MLHPRVGRLSAEASTVERNPALRALHSRMKAVDVDTGVAYDAGEPDLLRWVHVTIPWALLRACDRWGPAFTPAERDQFILEQRVAARLVGLDPESVPGNMAELE